MSNRIGGLLILGIVFGLSYLFYWYYFIYSLVNISFVSNVEKFTISMESNQKKYNFECENNTCNYNNISPFEYNIHLISQGYKDINFVWKPSKNNAIETIEFQKDYKLENVNLLSQDTATEILNETILSSQGETIEEKIQKLKDQQQIHLVIKKDKNTYIFRKNQTSLDLYKNEKYLGNFDYVEKSKISLDEVLGNPNYLSIGLNEKKYLFSISSGKLDEYILKIPVEYIKSSGINGQFIFVTQKGSFEYNLYKNTFSYNNYFSDFVYFNKDSLVGIINKSDEEKYTRFTDKSISNKTLVVQYFPDTKKTNILLETQENIKKIFKQEGKIYFEDENKSNFVISHLEE